MALLTCKSCGNTFIVDDSQAATYRPPDCTLGTCDLQPLNAGTNSEDSTSILEGYDFNAIKNQWQAQKAAQGGAPPPQPAAPPQQPAWGAPPAATPGGYPMDGGGEATQAFDVDEMLSQIDRPPGTPDFRSNAAPQPSGPAFQPPPAQPQAPPAGGGFPPPSAPPGVGGMDVNTTALNTDQVNAMVPQRHQVRIGGGGGGGFPGQPNPYPGQPGPYPGQPGPYPGQPGPYPGHPYQQHTQGGSGKGLIIAIVALLLIGLGVGAFFLFSGDDEASGGSKKKAKKTFLDRIEATLAAPDDLSVPTFNGELKKSGVIIAISASDGVFLEDELVAAYTNKRPAASDLVAGTPLIEPLHERLLEIGEDLDDDERYVILLADRALPYKGYFPVVFTAYYSGFRVFLGGRSTRADSLATLPIDPHNWPSAPSSTTGPPPAEADSPVRFSITPKQIEITIEGEEPIVSLKKGNYDKSSLEEGIKKGKDKTTTVRIHPDGDLEMEKLLELLEVIRGDTLSSNFDVFLFEAP